jgi:hypothetical protein
MKRLVVGLALLAFLIPMVGCDSNPSGPRVDSGPSASSEEGGGGGAAAPKDKARTKRGHVGGVTPAGTQ